MGYVNKTAPYTNPFLVYFSNHHFLGILVSRGKKLIREWKLLQRRQKTSSQVAWKKKKRWPFYDVQSFVFICPEKLENQRHHSQRVWRVWLAASMP